MNAHWNPKSNIPIPIIRFEADKTVWKDWNPLRKTALLERVVTKQKNNEKKKKTPLFCQRSGSDEPLSFSLSKKLADSDTGYLHRLFLRGPTVGSVSSGGFFLLVSDYCLPLFL